MNYRWFLLLAFFCGFSGNLIGQQTPAVLQGVILSVEGEKVFLDLNQDQVKIGDRLQVVKPGGFFTHPVTGERIPRADEVIAFIEISNVWANYSEGRVSPRGAINNLEAGMSVSIMKESQQRETREFRKSIAVQPMNVSSARGGYLGFYIADLLTEELFNVDKFKVIDRQTLGLQMDEIALTSMGVIDEREALTLGRTKGVDYFITGTVYEPDVIETSTGIPIKGIVTAAEVLSGQRLGSGLVSDVRVSQLRAIVNISLRVVDVETGEILFIASEMQQAVGRSQVDLEQGALGGMQLQGGATSFLNTITGQATRAALVNLAGYIDNYFEGKMDVRNFRGNVIDIAKVGTREERRNQKFEEMRASIISLEPLTKRKKVTRFEIIVDKGISSGYDTKRYYNVYEPTLERSKITGEMDQEGIKKIGTVYFSIIEENTAKGILELRRRERRDPNEKFESAWVGR